MLFGRRYRVTEKVGSGGMAEVFKAVDETLGRTVAVKVLHPRYAADPTFAARFRQEAQAAANLQSPYIVNIYDWGQDGDTYYIVMEYVRGHDLKSLIAQRGPLDSHRAAEIGAQVCQALSVAHGYDVIHRDIKPHNIMVTPDGSVKVMDFGIARAGNTTMTQTGSVLGTAHYVSPEQAQGKPLTAASDLYSLGIVLYEASTGKLPFDADAPVAVALKQVNEQPRPPRQMNSAVDPSLETVIMHALSKQPAQRYQTADEMRRDLVRVAQGMGVDATTVMPAAVPMVTATPDETSVMPAVGGEDRSARAIRVPARRRPRVWPWVLLAALLIAAGLAAAWQLGLFGTQTAIVPDVIGKTGAQAEAELVGAGFKVDRGPDEFNDEVRAGVVVRQNPSANLPAKRETTVTIVLSKGQDLVSVPDLEGLDEQGARSLLTDRGFTASFSQQNSDVEQGKVVSQDPAAGADAARGSVVNVVISQGPELVEVPNMEGRRVPDARSSLGEAGFEVKVVEQLSETVEKGRVISQTPNGGLKPTGSTVTLTVSKGDGKVATPDVIGLNEAQAREKIDAAGLAVSVEYQPSQNLSGVVLEQSPRPRTRVQPGSTVMVIVDAEPTTPGGGVGGNP